MKIHMYKVNIVQYTTQCSFGSARISTQKTCSTNNSLKFSEILVSTSIHNVLSKRPLKMTTLCEYHELTTNYTTLFFLVWYYVFQFQ